MADDDDQTTRPPQAGLSEQGADVGGIPSTLNQGVDHASDRAAGRREGTLESNAGGAIPPSLPVSQDSAALSSRPARDTTGAAVPAAGATPQRQASTHAADGDRAESDAGDSGADDSLPESLGKAISEPFKSN